MMPVNTITETNRTRYTSDKNEKVRSAYVRVKIHICTWYIYIYYIYNMLNESQPKPKPRRQHSTHKKKTG